MAKLIIRHTAQGNDPLTRAKDQLKFYGMLLQGLSVRTYPDVSQPLANMSQKGTHHTAHLKLQQEIAHWAYLEEEVKRKMVSAGSRQGR